MRVRHFNKNFILLPANIRLAARLNKGSVLPSEGKPTPKDSLSGNKAMKHFYILCLTALMAGWAATGSAASATDNSTASAGKQKAAFARQSVKKAGSASRFNMPKIIWTADDNAQQATTRAARAPQDKVNASISGVPYWNYIEGPDNTYWFYTQNLNYDGSKITKSLITVYDSKHKKQGEITINIPGGKYVNDIEPYGKITTKFFDRNESTMELPVYVHEVGDNNTNIDTIYIYNLQGEMVQKFEGNTGLQFDASVNDWTRYERFILIPDTLITENGVTKDYSKIKIYKPGGWNSTNAELDHEILLDNDLWNYSDGPFFNTYNIDGEPYYTVSYYEKIYDSNQDNATGDFEIIPTENNHYIIDVYNRKYEKVKTISVPVVKSLDATYRFASFGMFSNEDLSIGKFTGDDDFNFVLTFTDYVNSSDSYLYTYEVYNGNGEKVKTISEGVNVFKKLSDIVGHEEQYLFMKTTDEGEYLDVLNIPSCEKVTTIPATLEEEIISTNMDRYAKNGSYQYAISLMTPYIDAEENVYGQIGWYNRDLTKDHIVRFNLTADGIYMSPLLDGKSLDPFLFDTDNEHEYIYLANLNRPGSTVKDTYLRVADSDGSTMFEWTIDQTKGAIRTVSLANEHTDTPTLSIAYYNDNTGNYHIDFHALPFEKFKAGGDGSKNNPYRVATVGDLKQINNDPDAHYLQVADIDMNSYSKAWTPLKTFTGEYNGNGRAISNMTITGCKSYYAGLFESLGENAKIWHIIFNDPTIEVLGDNGYVGVLAGSAIKADITGVHVNYPIVRAADADAEPIFGGIVGTIALNSTISSSSFNDASVNLPAAGNVGGIAGESQTSTLIKACAVSGDFVAGNTLGGIAGYTGKGAEIHNSHVNATLTAGNTIGGIVGYNGARGLISNCLAEGSIEATKTGWDGLAVGGIAGRLEPDWATLETNGDMVEQSKVAKVIAGNVANLSDITLPAGSESDKSVNEIVGYSIGNEENHHNASKPLAELGVKNNYTSSAMLIGGSAVESVNDSTIVGASVAPNELVAEFFRKIGFAYGTATDAPWKGDALPVLYFEDSQALGIDGATAAKPGICISQGMITADDATRIELYNVAGQKLAAAAGSLSVKALVPGIYVIVATDINGNKQTQKVAVK